MCGIHAAISWRSADPPNAALTALLQRRGPDRSGQIQSRSRAVDGRVISLSFTSTVLALRGHQVTVQPLEDPESGSILCWNGEAWKIGQDRVKGNDGEDIVKLFATSISSSKIDSVKGVLQVLRSISGPYAFVFFDRTHDLVFYGRDCLGRRSLLYNSKDVPDTLELSSITNSASGTWKEVEADAIYMLALTELPDAPFLCPQLETNHFQDAPFRTYKFPWISTDTQMHSVRIIWFDMLPVTCESKCTTSC